MRNRTDASQSTDAISLAIMSMVCAVPLAAVGYALVRLGNAQGEEGILLVVIVNIGAVFGLLTIAVLLGVGLTKVWRRRVRGPD
jgi:hypothetical protein